MASSMYTIIKSVIDHDPFDLESLLAKIDAEWVKSAVTDEEREELVEAARAKADPEASKGSDTERIRRLEGKVADLEARVAELEAGGDSEEPDEPEALPYDPSHWYQLGERCVYKGRVYEWNMEGVDGVWSPEGYPAGWTLIGEAPEEEAGEPEQGGEAE